MNARVLIFLVVTLSSAEPGLVAQGPSEIPYQATRLIAAGAR